MELAPLDCGMAIGQTFPLETMEGLTASKVMAEAVVHKRKKGIRVTEPPGATANADPPLLLPVKDFENGTIEAEVSGARGFVGIAFRAGDGTAKYDAFYPRPANGRAEDQVRRNHSGQYISHPAWPRRRLGKEEPETYESYVDLAPGARPTPVVNELKQGAWTGPGLGPSHIFET